MHRISVRFVINCHFFDACSEQRNSAADENPFLAARLVACVPLCSPRPQQGPRTAYQRQQKWIESLHKKRVFPRLRGMDVVSFYSATFVFPMRLADFEYILNGDEALFLIALAQG